MTTKKLKRILLIVSAATLGLIVLFMMFPNAALLDNTAIKDTVRFEIIKNLLSLFVIVIVGGFIAYLFKSREETEKQEQIRMDIRLDYFKRLGRIYRNVKSVRRALRAGGLTTEYVESGPGIISEQGVVLYKAQMESLNKSQLKLEELKIEAGSLPAFVHLEKVQGYLNTMEGYLRDILDEFEEKSPLLKAGNSIDFKELEHLDEFTGSAHRFFTFSPDKKQTDINITSPFKIDFSGSYATAIREIGENLNMEKQE